jgi:hypothetical protein
MSIHDQIEGILKTFRPISLKEMDTVELMNRIDSKYIFGINLLPEILTDSKEHFKVLEINSERLFRYTTTYYDTTDLAFFRNHISGKLNRHKIRHRTYESTGVSYLEVKFKTNKNRTIKWRMKDDINEYFNPEASNFVLNRANIPADKLHPVVTNCFKRITLVNIEDKTRITLDFDLSFKGNTIQKTLPYLAIAEIKQEGRGCNNLFVQILKKKGIRQSGFSKYCVGSALLDETSRVHTLKPKILELKKIEKEYGMDILR